MYFLIRAALAIILLIALVVAIRIMKGKAVIYYVWAIIGVLSCSFVSLFMDIERIAIRFETAEELYRYYEADTRDIIQGEDTAIRLNGGALAYKTDRGWLMENERSTVQYEIPIPRQTRNNQFQRAQIVQSKRTGDTYLRGVYSSITPQMMDSSGTSIVRIHHIDGNNYAGGLMPELTEEYWITIDGISYVFTDGVFTVKD